MQSSDSSAIREMLGYLNFSAGKPDARFQKSISDYYRTVKIAEPHQQLAAELRSELATVRGTTAAFRNIDQSEAVIAAVFDGLLPEYRTYHRDVLAHLTDNDLFQPFFLARCFEAVLREGGPWSERERIVRGALKRLNDFVGYRPVAVLERKRCEPYDHEWLRPLPLYICGVGVAPGKYARIIEQSLEILRHTERQILADAQFNLDHLDELSLDPRAYDFGHPVNHRPNYQFGEWDPHNIDNAGNYRRFVLRQVTLDALFERCVGSSAATVADTGQTLSRAAHGERNDRLEFEASAVLAGIMLMASATSGAGPEAYDSSVTLATLVPKIAQLRDRFYEWLIQTVASPHGDALRDEAARLRQPFGGARQHLNQTLARRRAVQLQHTFLARLFAEMGYPEASRSESQRVATASERMTTEMICRITSTHALVEQGELSRALNEAEGIEELLHRGIGCGAIVDPWNILGSQGQFSVFPALENTVPDPRVSQLTELVEQILSTYARLLAATAAAGDQAEHRLRQQLHKFADWWDRFATSSVSGVQQVLGRASVEAATHVARAMADWRQGGEAVGNIKFWREHSGGFTSARAYAQVVETLLEKPDHVAAMALLMSWLGQSRDVPLEQPPHSFFELAIHWFTSNDEWPLAVKFIDYLESNADEYWLVPSLEFGANVRDTGLSEQGDDDEPDSVYSAAYDGVTFRDSAQDGHDGETLDGSYGTRESDWDAAAERLEPRLRFLSMLSTMWRVAAERAMAERLAPTGGELLPANRKGAAPQHPENVRLHEQQPVFESWIRQLNRNQVDLSKLAAQIEQTPIAAPLGSQDSLLEYDRHRSVKERLVHAVIGTQLETANALRRLWCVSPCDSVNNGISGWESHAITVEHALLARDLIAVEKSLERLIESLAPIPLVYRRLDRGGSGREILATRSIQETLRCLVKALPRLGLLRDTFRVLRTAGEMERDHPVPGEGITEFDHLFRAGLRAVTESVVDAAADWPEDARSDRSLLDCLENLTEPFMHLWLEHSKGIQLSVLDRIRDDKEWNHVRKFIETFGHDLLTPQFLTVGNLRSILDRGAGRYLSYLEDNPDPLRPIRLIDELDQTVSRDAAVRRLELIIQVFLENYEEYKDYNSTTAQSDYGERYFILFEFLRLKNLYTRTNWNLQPIAIVHEVLARKGRGSAARLWQEALHQKSAATSDQLLSHCASLESSLGVRLTTVRDRLSERFTRPLALDQIRLQIAPVMEQARSRTRNNPRTEANATAGATPIDRGNHLSDSAEPTAFQQFHRELMVLAGSPTGVGLDVPGWLRSLESEVDRVRHQMDRATPAVDVFTAIPARFSLLHVMTQLESWSN